jgi:bifunctional non-homologous end joining protein LigD
VGKVPFRISPMLATLVDQPFSRENWIFEEKYDGVRMLAYKEGRKVSLISRNAIDRTSRYPTVAAELGKLRADTAALDGEIVAVDTDKVSRFQLLQQGRGTIKYVVFDCLYKDGGDLRGESLSVRRQALEQLIGSSTTLQSAARLALDGMAAYEIAIRRGLEGVIGKDSSSPYVEGRSRAWLKVKVKQEDEFVIGGFTAPEGSRQHFGALLLGAFHRNGLQYVGKVGSGFSDEILRTLFRKMKPLARARSPFASDVREKSATFVSPQLVAQIGFTERTKEGKLRHPVYLGLRDDKNAKEVVQ